MVSAGLGAVVILVPYPRIMRWSWVIFGAVVIALLLLPFFGTTINGARRWFVLPGFAIQPSEFVLDATGTVLAATYSSGPLGRMNAEDVVRYITMVESRKG